MRLELNDPAYAERLVSFLHSVGQAVAIVDPSCVEISGEGEALRLEVELYVGVWRVIHPHVDVALVD